MKKPRSREADIHLEVVNYLKLAYKDVLFRTDFASGLKMSIFQAMKHKRLQSSRAFPDIFIYQPSRGFHGLALELKRESPYRKDGTLKKDPHLEEQAAMLVRLSQLGYQSQFAVGFDDAKKIIDNYLRK
jgi:hypothetical protein